MSEMKNIPKSIYLNIGEDINGIDNFDTLREVTWSETVIDNNDVEYFRKQSPKAMIAEGLRELRFDTALMDEIMVSDCVQSQHDQLTIHQILDGLYHVCKQDKPKGGKG